MPTPDHSIFMKVWYSVLLKYFLISLNIYTEMKGLKRFCITGMTGVTLSHSPSCGSGSADSRQSLHHEESKQHHSNIPQSKQKHTFAFDFQNRKHIFMETSGFS